MIAQLRDRRALSQQVAFAGAAGLVVFKVASSPNDSRESLLLSLLVALLLLPVLARHPTATLCTLVIFLPLQVPLLAFLFEHGLPQVAARRLGALKDLAVISLLLRAYLDRGTRVSRPADRWLLGYAAVATAYLFLPLLFSTLTQIPLSQRIVAWRVEVFFALLLIALRWIDAQRLDPPRIRFMIMFTGFVIAAGAIYEYFDPSGWTHFLYRTLGIGPYSAQVLNIPLDETTFLRFTDSGAVRSGSFLREPVFCAFFLLPSFFVALTKISSRTAVLSTLLTGTIAFGLICTGTRSALVVAAIGAVLASARVLRSGSQYTRYFVPVLAILLVVSPVLIAQSAVASRVTAAVNGSDGSTQGHSDDLAKGVERALQDPLGKGLGSGAGSGQRFDVTGAITTENAYLQVINEMGILALIAFVGLLFQITRELSRLPARASRLLLDSAAGLALSLAMIIGGVLQTVWLDIGVGVNVVVVLALPLLQDQLDRSTRSLTAPSNHRADTSALPAGA